MSEPTCETCRYCVGELGRMTCRANPPIEKLTHVQTGAALHQYHYVTSWPPVRFNDWCAAHSEKVRPLPS